MDTIWIEVPIRQMETPEAFDDLPDDLPDEYEHCQGARQFITEFLRQTNESISESSILERWRYSGELLEAVQQGDIRKLVEDREQVWLEGDPKDLQTFLCCALHSAHLADHGGSFPVGIKETEVLSGTDIADSIRPEEDSGRYSTVHQAASSSKNGLLILTIEDGNVGRQIGASVTEILSVRHTKGWGPTWLVTTTENPFEPEHPCWTRRVQQELRHPLGWLQAVKLGDSSDEPSDIELTNEKIAKLPGPRLLEVVETVGEEPSADEVVWVIGTVTNSKKENGVKKKVWIDHPHLPDKIWLPWNHANSTLREFVLNFDLPDVEEGKIVALPFEWQYLGRFVDGE